MDENPKVEYSDFKVALAGVCFSNATPASRLAGQMKSVHDPDEISEVPTDKPVVVGEEVKPHTENIENREDLPPDSNTDI